MYFSRGRQRRYGACLGAHSVTLSLRTFYMDRRQFLTYHVTSYLTSCPAYQLPTLGDRCVHLHAWVPVHVYSNPYPHLSSSSSSVLIHQQSSIVNHHCPIYSLFSPTLTPDDSELHLRYYSLEVGGYTITLLHSYAHSQVPPPGIIPRYHTHQLLHSRSKISLTYPLPSTALVNPYSENR